MRPSFRVTEAESEAAVCAQHDRLHMSERPPRRGAPAGDRGGEHHRLPGRHRLDVVGIERDLLGGAGGLEAGITVLALRDQIVPPTMNLDNPGEGCDLDFVANAARKVTMDYAMSNSFGFGGTNGCLVFKRWTE